MNISDTNNNILFNATLDDAYRIPEGQYNHLDNTISKGEVQLVIIHEGQPLYIRIPENEWAFAITRIAETG